MVFLQTAWLYPKKLSPRGKCKSPRPHTGPSYQSGVLEPAGAVRESGEVGRWENDETSGGERRSEVLGFVGTC